MIVLVFVLFAAVAFWMSVYGLVFNIFCHPRRKRPDAHRIPESTLYKDYREIMHKGVEEVDNTPGEDIRIVSPDGCMLYGKFYVFRENAPLLIFFHGYHGVPAWDGYGFFKICKKHGINILMADERAHGKSGGRFITFGIRERYDCKAWADYAAERFGENTDIFLAGVSMGAASVLMSSKLGLPQNVKALLADCGYTEPSAIIKETVRKMGLPVKPMYALIHLGARIFGRFELEEATALNAVKNLRIPVLFLHGKQDSVVPLAMSDALYESCAGQKERVLIEGADHANSAMTDYESYENAVLQFLRTANQIERSSTRSYTAEKLTEEELKCILTAGLQAPTARNEQEVHISVLAGDSRLVKEIEQERIRLLLEEEEDEERREKIRNNPFNFCYNAPTLLLLSVKKDFYWNRVDAGICVENIALAAQSMGLGSLIIGCIRGAMEGEKKDYFAKEAQFPENYEFAVAVALGHINTGKEPHTIDFEKAVSFIE